jgi:hypothetical protein
VVEADPPLRRLLVCLLVAPIVIIVISLWNGDDPGTTAGQGLAALVGIGFLVGCRLYANRG